MEYDADRYEAKSAGSDLFAATMSQETREKILQQTEEAKTGIFIDTHPSDEDRVAMVMREKTNRVFRGEGRAKDLFLRFDQVSQGVTWDFYRQVVNPQIRQGDLVPVAALLADTRPAEKNRPVTEDEAPLPFDSLNE